MAFNELKHKYNKYILYQFRTIINILTNFKKLFKAPFFNCFLFLIN
jgi:hypothetical protein